MDITYYRQVAHCEPSKYVSEVTIKEVSPAENSDFLERITFEEIGWNAIAKKGLYEPGTKVFFIPAETILPAELSDEMDVTKYLAKGKVRVTRLRGNRSEGLIVPREKVEPYLPYLLSWEDPPSVQMKGNACRRADIPLEFEIFYKMPNLLNETDVFDPGESIYFSEKIHGTNTRVGFLKSPETGEYQLYVGSHRIALRQDEKNLYWRTVLSLGIKFPPDYIFYGEIFGGGVQKGMHYERAVPDILFFAATHKGEYLTPRSFMALCSQEGIPRVKMHPTVYSGIEKARMWADLESEYTDRHMREGVVLVSAFRPRRMAKVIGFDYLAQKDNKKTERH